MGNKKNLLRPLELLAPAGNVEIAREAILHGADAVYIGGPSHGARKNAGNSIEDIRDLVDFAHQFRAKVYVTVNTIVYDKELRDVERLITKLYQIGVDALIVQDMGILRLDIPPIPLHASTQCDTRTVEKARFLGEVGFSQIVLARELSLKEIKEIYQSVSVPLECFVHGALCVSYSGRCHASQFVGGRSANRGECAQLCRLPYTLRDADGKVIKEKAHLLSLKDFNTIDVLEELVEAGASSFKIEGRLKEASYVKNVTAAYRKRLDEIIAANPDKYVRSSYGRSEISFEPSLSKSFNRGFTRYFLDGRKTTMRIASLATPKSMGETITSVNQLNPGDGVSYFDRNGEYCGLTVNGVDRGRIISRSPVNIPKGTELHRTFDRQWTNQLNGNTAVRKIALNVEIDDKGLSGCDERGVKARVAIEAADEKARTPQNPTETLSKLGTTIYEAVSVENNLSPETFIPASRLTAARRRLVEMLDTTNRSTYPYDYRRKENKDYPYPSKELDYRDNVANHLAREFYIQHGVERIEPAMEVRRPEQQRGETVVMTTRHCILRELGMCRRKSGVKLSEPLTISSGKTEFELRFRCDRCEMEVVAPFNK